VRILGTPSLLSNDARAGALLGLACRLTKSLFLTHRYGD
jgi:hypothetical protein